MARCGRAQPKMLKITGEKSARAALHFTSSCLYPGKHGKKIGFSYAHIIKITFDQVQHDRCTHTRTHKCTNSHLFLITGKIGRSHLLSGAAMAIFIPVVVIVRVRVCVCNVVDLATFYQSCCCRVEHRQCAHRKNRRTFFFRRNFSFTNASRLSRLSPAFSRISAGEKTSRAHKKLAAVAPKGPAVIGEINRKSL